MISDLQAAEVELIALRSLGYSVETAMRKGQKQIIKKQQQILHLRAEDLVFAEPKIYWVAYPAANAKKISIADVFSLFSTACAL